MIVADSTLVASAVIRGASTAAALHCRTRDREWISPRLLRSELLNVLVKYVSVARSLDRDEGLKAFRRGLSLVIWSDAESDPVDVLNLCDHYGITAYDAEFVALAMKRNFRLVTLDNGLLKAFPGIAISPADFAAGK